MSNDILSKIYYCMERVVVLEGIEDVLTHIVKTAASLTQAEAASLRLFNIETGELDIQAGFGLSEDFLAQPALALGEGIIGKVVQNCAPYRSNEVMNDPDCSQKDLAHEEGVNAILSVPLKNKQTAIGSLTVYRRSKMEFTDAELLLMSIFAAQAVEAVEKTEQLEHLKRQATFDSLTGAYNREFLVKRVEEELKRAQRHDHRFSLIFIDLDDFKKFNDSHGHLLGDKFLKDFISLVSSELRKNDFLGRYGGEEFVIITPETEKQGAVALSRKLLDSTVKKPFMGSDGVIQGFSFSAGVSSFPGDGQDSAELISKADDAMYQVKKQGKNGVLGYVASKEGSRS